MLDQERASGIRHLDQTDLGHLEHADLLGGSEAVLRGAQDAQGREPFALEVDDGIDEMLQGLGAGDRAVLRHVPGQDDRDSLALGVVHQADGRLADLADAPSRPVQVFGRRGLDGVHDQRGEAAGTCFVDDSARPRARRGRSRGPPPRHRAGRGARPAIGPGRPIPRPSHTGRGSLDRSPRTSPAAACSRSVDLPMPGSPPRRISDPGTRPPPRTRSSSPIPTVKRGRSTAPRSPSACAVVAPPSPGRGDDRAERDGSRMTVSTRLFQAPHTRHWPSQRRTASPQDWQTYRLCGFATGALADLDRRPRLRCLDDQTGVRVPVHDDGGPGLVLAEEEVLSEHVFNHVLDDAAQRPCAVCRRRTRA